MEIVITRLKNVLSDILKEEQMKVIMMVNIKEKDPLKVQHQLERKVPRWMEGMKTSEMIFYAKAFPIFTERSMRTR